MSKLGRTCQLHVLLRQVDPRSRSTKSNLFCVQTSQLVANVHPGQVSAERAQGSKTSACGLLRARLLSHSSQFEPIEERLNERRLKLRPLSGR